MNRAILLAALLPVTSSAWAGTPVEATNPDGQPMRFHLYRPCLEETFWCAPRILAQGRIDYDSADALRAFVAQARIDHPKLPAEMLVCLDSGRGEVGGAIRLGATIRALKLSTCVEGRYEEEILERRPDGSHKHRALADEPLCTSVCVLTLAGGTNRYVAAGARVAVRHFSESGQDSAASATRVSMEELQHYLQNHGVDPGLLDIAVLTPPDTARFLSEEDLLFYRIATHEARFSLSQRR